MNVYILFSAFVAVVLAIASFPLFYDTNYWLKRRSMRPPVADLIVRDAVIYTGDASLPFADSMAILSGRVLSVGNYSSLKYLGGHGTKELNLGGKVVVPGFIDSHVHLISGGLQMVQVELHGVNCIQEFVRRVKAAVRHSKQGSWILGGGWNNNLWGGELPVASWIDDVTPNNPLWLIRMDGHMGLANSVALKLSKIIKSSADPNGGSIMRTMDGEPTGLLIDSAMQLLLPWIPEPSIDERRDALIRASKLALTRGVTTVVDVGRYFPGTSTEDSWNDFLDVYSQADSFGEMKIRACLFFPLETWSRLLDLRNKWGHAMSQWIYFGGVKAFSDGSLGSKSALFYEPYVDDPHNRGLQVMEVENILNMTLAADNSGLQVAIHAIGDRANDLILDMYDSVASVNGVRDRRFRIEHAQHLAPGATARFGQQQIISSVQPQHLIDDADIALKKLGTDRAQKGSYLFRSLLNSNVELAFGSDWPVVNLNPLAAIKMAMKRIPSGWKDAWNPSECLSLQDALKAHTISSARACFLDNDLGSLSPGKLADFVILSTQSWDYFETEGSAFVEATYVGGVQAYP